LMVSVHRPGDRWSGLFQREDAFDTVAVGAC
jgi:hypothetical protein